jgi:N-acetylmuramoyl-L-alanine amidase CwlA
VKDASGDSNKWYFTEETQESLVYLVSKLMDEYSIPIDRVIRHYDVTGKICPNPYVKNNNLRTSWTWGQFKDNLLQYRKNGTVTLPFKDAEEIKTDEFSSVTVKMRTLRKGSTGKDVAVWQIIVGTNPDGDFGTKTRSATVKWQKANKIKADGVVDKNDWTKGLKML